MTEVVYIDIYEREEENCKLNRITISVWGEEKEIVRGKKYPDRPQWVRHCTNNWLQQMSREELKKRNI